MPATLKAQKIAKSSQNCGIWGQKAKVALLKNCRLPTSQESSSLLSAQMTLPMDPTQDHKARYALATWANPARMGQSDRCCQTFMPDAMLALTGTMCALWFMQLPHRKNNSGWSICSCLPLSSLQSRKKSHSARPETAKTPRVRFEEPHAM